jgi:hypothetical protein
VVTGRKLDMTDSGESSGATNSSEIHVFAVTRIKLVLPHQPQLGVWETAQQSHFYPDRTVFLVKFRVAFG